MIVTYNKEQVGDVLMLTLKNSGEAKLAVERKGKVARVYREDKQETVAWNIFDNCSKKEHGLPKQGQMIHLQTEVLHRSIHEMKIHRHRLLHVLHHEAFPLRYQSA